MVRIGTAGWTLPPAVQAGFPPGASHLHRYAQVFGACEINSSFHRPHRPATYARWAASVPPGFAFSAKLPQAITHERRLAGCEDLLQAFLAECAGLGGTLHVLLVQLPPSLAWDAPVAQAFFGQLRSRWPGHIALEPRHASWFTPDVDAWLATQRVARVLADPVLHAGGDAPGGWPGLVYLRLHGSPRTYHSAYDPAVLQALAVRLAAAQDAGAQAWCLFDNTASGAATADALQLQRLLAQT